MKLSEKLAEVLTKYGKSNYKNVELDDMREDISSMITNCPGLSKVETAKAMVIANAVKHSKTKEAVLTKVTESMFELSGDIV